MKRTSECIKILNAGVWIVFLLGILSACSDEPAASGSDEPAANGPTVSRAVREPSGANCPEGGTAVQSGADRDGDGVLDDDEVETTLYVCERDRVRLVVEPAGANCADGGTAVWVGDDRDGDGVLEQSEVNDVAYLCETVHALLTRVVQGAPGAPCIGAVAIQAGHDLDDDGVLDDAEVLVTEYVCGAAIQGDLRIDDPADVAFYQGVRAVVGDVVIGGQVAGQVELPNLWIVGGSVKVDFAGALTSLRLPALSSVGGSFEVRSNTALTSLDLPALSRVGASFEIRDNWELAALHVPALDEVRWGFELSDNRVLAEVEVPRLSTVGSLTLRQNSQLAGLDLDGIDILGDLFIANNAALSQIDWAGVFVGGHIALGENPALAMVRLEIGSFYSPSTGINVVRNPQLGALYIKTPRVDGTVNINSNVALATLQLDVYSVSGALWIIDNPLLTEVNSLPLDYGISTVHDLWIKGSPISNLTFGPGLGLWVGGDALISDLHVTALRDLQGGLRRVSGTLSLHDNPGLVDVQMLGGHDVHVFSNPALQTATFSYDNGSGGSLVVVNNPMLERLSTWGPDSIHAVTISDNPLLVEPDLRLSTAYSIEITNNASLPVCRIQALFDSVAASSEVQYGNDEAGTCN